MKKTDRKNLYIPSIDAKDIYITNHFIEDQGDKNTGYRTTKPDGSPNYNRFINSFDYSLDLIDLRKIANKVYSKDDSLSFINKGKEYSSKIINITFKYCVREFNQITHDYYVRFGYNVPEREIKNGNAHKLNNNKDILIAIKLNYPTSTKIEKNILPDYFEEIEDKVHNKYIYRLKENKIIPLIINAKTLRKTLYKDGFICDGIKYIRYKRSCGSSRVGKVLFIDERLYDLAHKSEQCGLDVKIDDQIDLAAFEAYISLPSSTIIDTMHIDPKCILVMDDYESKFKEQAVRTYQDDKNLLCTEEREMNISNSIWDGQSLIDKSLMGIYSEKGMILLRNKFFKSCCFNTNIQQFFKDNNITSVKQLNGITLAKNIEDIKIITTKSSIKYFKFGSYEDWCKNIYKDFGVVKYDKDTHFFDGRLVQTHYQLLNTLQLSEDQVSVLLKQSLDYLNMLNNDIDVMRFHLGMEAADEGFTSNIMKTKNDIVNKLLKFNCGFENTNIYHEFKNALCKAYKKNLKKGHILVSGTYATLLGNPYEMLLASINKFDGTAYMQVGTVYTKRYEFDKDVLCIRSPHVTIGNIFVTHNTYYEMIDKYFNLTDKIICLNAIKENTLERLSGADFDSDAVMLTNDSVLLEAAKKYYSLFKVPTRDIQPPKMKRKYNAEDLADLDNKTGSNKIGEIVNLSQVLNSILWDKVAQNGGDAYKCYDQIKSIYYDVCQLDVMSNIEIDKAKKVFTVDNAKELKRIRDRYEDELISLHEKKYLPKFLVFITKLKGFYDGDRKEGKEYQTTMDSLLKKINKNRFNNNKQNICTLTEIFKPLSSSTDIVNNRQIKVIIDSIKTKQNYINAIYANKNIEKEIKTILIENCYENLSLEINKMKLNHATMYNLLKQIDKKSNAKIRSLLFTILFSYGNEELITILEKLKRNNIEIIPDPNGELIIYGEKYTKNTLF